MTFSNALKHVLGLFCFCFEGNIVQWSGTHAKKVQVLISNLTFTRFKDLSNLPKATQLVNDRKGI